MMPYKQRKNPPVGGLSAVLSDPLIFWERFLSIIQALLSKVAALTACHKNPCCEVYSIRVIISFGKPRIEENNFQLMRKKKCHFINALMHHQN